MDVDRARQRLSEERTRIEATLTAARSMGEGGGLPGTDLSHVGIHPSPTARTCIEHREQDAKLP